MLSEDHNLILRIQVESPEKGNLYLGNIWAAENLLVDNQNQIKAILTVASQTELKFSQEDIVHKIIEAEDDPNFNLSPKFDEGVQFIEQQLQKTNVLVHCFAGVSRSATLVLAYLMKHHQLSLDDALRLVRKQRSIAGPNLGFMKQLQKYEQELKNK